MFSIDFQSRIPIYEQIVSQVEQFIISGIIKENDQLPSVRQVAFELGINPNTIQRAYTELERKGVIITVMGKGSFISNNIENVIGNRIDEIINNIKKEILLLKEMGLDDKTIKMRIIKDQN